MTTFNTSTTRRHFLAALGAAAVSKPFSVFAQNDRPISFILPVGPGSGVDTIVRAAGPALSKALKHTVVIENKPGAGGILGTSALVKSVADGFTLSVVSNNHVIFPSVYKSLPFDPIADITPISVIGSTPLLLVVNPRKLPVANVQELIAALKKRPGEYNFASSGNGTILHLAAEMFVDQANVQARHIPYKGVGPMITDLLGGQVDFGVLSLPSILAHLQSGGLRAVGMGSKTRASAMPDLPTLAEQGLPDYDMAGWFAVVGPAGLPEAKVKEIYAAFTEAFNAPDVQKSMKTQGNTIQMMPPEDTARYFQSELNKYAAVVKSAGIELQ
ncbi:tripartite tricarboxylate transporter substrate binding protein [Candidimonas sp. SYP-B2681]|uniref:Bug family tripartite tricarboxylate transporter substrate binding protein n=1 Tax=Candidimonas sp. SYP-B2681 TaxID=2497686 RepID=UPI000F89C29D|nr:tripartite tricarboxylate transporter substrate binding protein [Candidimonas sp. SYP-B2681]RTZ40042.1 tripartite tricarboxylate transporter substrate binding protein [Candidimonas sp. SYP-B2681]